MNIFQHRLASGFVACIAIIVCYISFTRQPSDAYLFPRVISVFFLTLALWTFVKALMGLSKVGNGLSAYMFKNMLPGVLIFFRLWRFVRIGHGLVASTYEIEEHRHMQAELYIDQVSRS